MIGAGAATTDTATGGKNMNPCKKPSKCSVCRSVQLSVKTQTDRGPRKGPQVEDWDHYIPSPGPFMAISRPNDLVDPPDSELHRTPSRPRMPRVRHNIRMDLRRPYLAPRSQSSILAYIDRLNAYSTA
jgi:hypothetical protein